ncbi:hypothetical protein DFJ74DRAFT_658464 [Hyaloraphidium curvatum]|nr:hypothetical protein DFJ74DRAFT_658464 [Hyaloraphidium curvatum]
MVGRRAAPRSGETSGDHHGSVPHVPVSASVRKLLLSGTSRVEKEIASLCKHVEDLDCGSLAELSDLLALVSPPKGQLTKHLSVLTFNLTTPDAWDDELVILDEWYDAWEGGAPPMFPALERIECRMVGNEDAVDFLDFVASNAPRLESIDLAICLTTYEATKFVPFELVLTFPRKLDRLSDRTVSRIRVYRIVDPLLALDCLEDNLLHRPQFRPTRVVDSWDGSFWDEGVPEALCAYDGAWRPLLTLESFESIELPAMSTQYLVGGVANSLEHLDIAELHLGCLDLAQLDAIAASFRKNDTQLSVEVIHRRRDAADSEAWDREFEFWKAFAGRSIPICKCPDASDSGPLDGEDGG